MESVEFAESQPLKRLGARRILRMRDNDLVSELEQSEDIVPPFQIRVATDFDFQHPTTHPRCPAGLHQSQNALNGFRLAMYARLALIIGQPV